MLAFAKYKLGKKAQAKELVQILRERELDLEILQASNELWAELN